MQQQFWDRRARKYDDEISRHDSLYSKTLQSTDTLLNDQDVLLDLGCASGEISLDLAPLVAQVHGIDTSGRMIELANQKMGTRNISNIKFSRTDAFDTSLVAHSFSAITAFNVLHLVENLPAVLDRLFCMLTPGGLLISQTPCLRERSRVFRILVSLAQNLRLSPPILNLAFDELTSLMIRSGFDILDSELWDQGQSIQRIVARRPKGY
jgi:2-polyprenyl-3-methyl-5-hydroxy-6-metoxy-1,4-benzoquinol methylase